MIKGRWACLPLSYCYYHLKKDIEKNRPLHGGKEIKFQSKHDQAVDMLTDVAGAFPESNIIVVADSWFGNNGIAPFPMSEDWRRRQHWTMILQYFARPQTNRWLIPLWPPCCGWRPHEIGKFCSIADNVTIINVNHNYDAVSEKTANNWRGAIFFS